MVGQIIKTKDNNFAKIVDINDSSNSLSLKIIENYNGNFIDIQNTQYANYQYLYDWGKFI